MHQEISLKEFLQRLSLKTGMEAELLEPILFDMFVQIRTNTECGLWVEIEGFGSFHPLWYEIKRHKNREEGLRIVQERRDEERSRREASFTEEAKEADMKIEKIDFERLTLEELQSEQKRLAEELSIFEAFESEASAQKSHEAELLLQGEKLSAEEMDREQKRLLEELAVFEGCTAKAKERKERVENILREREKEQKIPLEEDRATESVVAVEAVSKTEEKEPDKGVDQEAKAAEKAFEKALAIKKLERLRYEHQMKEEKAHQIINMDISATKTKKAQQKALLFILLSGLLLFFFWLFQSETSPPPPPKEETKSCLYKSFPKVEPNQKETTERFYLHRVKEGNSLYRLSQKLYGDSKYWPLIYVENQDKIHDMDKIYPSDMLKIPRIPKESTAQEALAKVYIAAYQTYKRLGKVNKAQWLLFWSSQHIDPVLLDRFIKDIDSEDRKMVQGYLKRFKEKP